MTDFNTKIDGQQLVDRETQTPPKETKLIENTKQPEINLQEVVMRYIETNVDTGEKEFEMIMCKTDSYMLIFLSCSIVAIICSCFKLLDTFRMSEYLYKYYIILF